MIRRSSVRLVSAVGALAFVLAGCQAAPDEAPETAPEEEVVEEGSVEAVEGEATSDGFLTLYSGRSETLVQPLIDQFSDETGIEVEVRYGNTGEMAALLLEEGEATQAGVFLSQDAGALGALSQAGLFSTLPEDISSRVQPGFTSTDGSWVGVTGRARVIVYNTDMVTEEQLPNTADELLEPQWSGLVGVAPTNASFQSYVTAYRVIDGEGAAEAWVSGLVANDPQYFEGNTPILEAVEAGAIPLGLINHYYWYRLVAERGLENLASRLWFTEAGDPTSMVNVTGVGILSPAQLDQDAIDFVDYMVSEAVQTYFVEQTYEYPLVNGIDAPADLPALESLVSPDLDLSDLESLSETQELLTRFGLL
jgi:iron(III) transport system substrate-binding protein